jgi:glycosyltransferase involved in cell wall biosynthesis
MGHPHFRRQRIFEMPENSIFESKTIACTAPFGAGGLGRHLKELAEDAVARGERVACYSFGPADAGPRNTAIPMTLPNWLLSRTPLRFSPGWSQCVANSYFDRAVARLLEKPEGPSVFVGFGGRAFRSMCRAKELGFGRLELVSASSHVRNVQRLHAIASARWPIEANWLNEHQILRTLREYEMADRIIVASDYTRKSFVDQGIPESKIVYFPMTADPRYALAGASRQPRTDGIFRIVYTGSLTVYKGIPLLIEAFGQLRERPAELTLVGGSSSRGMRRYLEAAVRNDPRIQAAPGDPLPHLLHADLYIHPSYEDGFAYAAAEALACGVPILVTEDTGMKEHIHSFDQGEIVPTGNVAALVCAIRRRLYPLPEPRIFR